MEVNGFPVFLESSNRNTYHLMSALSGNLKSKIHTCQGFSSGLEKVDRFSTLDEFSPVVTEHFLSFIQGMWVEYHSVLGTTYLNGEPVDMAD